MTDIFPAAGGTEILQEGLHRHVTVPDNVNIILSTPDIAKIRYLKKNVLWQHLNYSDESLAAMRDPAFVNALDASVYVSNWQLEKYRYLFGIPLLNSRVIKNAIDPIPLVDKPKGEKLRLIYTSTPFRGLAEILSVMELLDRGDIELDVYSSTRIYGSGFVAHVGTEYDDLFAKAEEMPNVNYRGWVPNSEVHTALQSAHIFAYPSVFEETACLAMIEAGAAGCRLVTTNLGALYETGGEWATLVPMQGNMQDMVRVYADALNEAIDTYWEQSTQDMLKRQSDYYNGFYSWERRAVEWERLFDELA
jgi:glycosyltransferase involved in cell wall biosynthesis